MSRHKLPSPPPCTRPVAKVLKARLAHALAAVVWSFCCLCAVMVFDAFAAADSRIAEHTLQRDGSALVEPALKLLLRFLRQYDILQYNGTQ